MPDCMNFPESWKDFLASYSFIDHEEVYTNKSELIPCFRVEQLIEHYFPEENKEHCYTCDNLEANDTLYQYTDWNGGHGYEDIRGIQYCPKCGRRLLTYEEKKKRAKETFSRVAKQMLEAMEKE